MTLDLKRILWYEKHEQEKKKIDRLDFIKVENFYTSEYTLRKVKTTHIIEENNCKSHT